MSRKEKSKTNNIAIQVNRQSINVIEKNLSIIDAENKPTISAGASYDLNYSNNPNEAFISQSSSKGLFGNVGISWLLYDAGRQVRKENTIIEMKPDIC